MKADEKLVLDQEAGKAYPGFSETSLNVFLAVYTELEMGFDLFKRENDPYHLFFMPLQLASFLSLRAWNKWKVIEDASTGSHFHGLGGVVIHENILDMNLQATWGICQVPGEELI